MGGLNGVWERGDDLTYLFLQSQAGYIHSSKLAGHLLAIF